MTPKHARLPLWQDKTPAEKLDALHDMVLDLYGWRLSAARAKVLAQLSAHAPADAKEARDIGRMAELITAHPAIFSATCEVGHITASAAIIEPAGRRTLLHRHKRLGRWLQVGGHADHETDLAQAALREAREETGLSDLRHWPVGEAPAPIDYDVHTIPQRGDYPEHLHLDFRYVLMTHQPEALAPSTGESALLRWLTKSDVHNLGDAIDDSLRRLLAKAFALLPPETAQV